MSVKNLLKKAQLKINNRPFPQFGFGVNEANKIARKAQEKRVTYWSLMPAVMKIRVGNKAWNKHLAYLRSRGIKVLKISSWRASV